MIKYIYIDDNPNISAQTSKSFSVSGRMETVLGDFKTSWNAQISYIKDIVRNTTNCNPQNENECSFGGFMLDLKLNDVSHDDVFAQHSGTSIAQELRTLQKEGDLEFFPIVLFSANENLLEDSNNLFDLRLSKDSPDYENSSKQMLAVYDAYKYLKNNRLDCCALGIDPTLLDDRLVSELDSFAPQPPHVIIRFLITQLLERQGVLINEDVLFARLGIDKANLSQTSIDTIKDKLLCIKYTGILSGGWDRWWAPKLEDLWDTISEGSYLRSTTAPERVAKFSEYFELTDIKPFEHENKDFFISDKYWTVCKGSNKPLDPIDGFLIQGQERFYPWQEKEYVSKYCALTSENKEVWKDVAVTEKERLEILREG